MEKHNHIDIENITLEHNTAEITVIRVGRIRKNVIHFS
jgi:hypothetical protein